MWTNESVELTGFGGRPIYNRYYAHEQPARALCVIIAGYAYTLQAPYLYFSKNAPFVCDYDVLAIDLEYSRTESFLSLGDEDKEQVFLTDIEAIRRYLDDKTGDRRLAFIGKSLGTSTVFRLLQNDHIRSKTDGCVWLTPGQDRRRIFELLSASSMPGMVVWGTRDRYAADVEWPSLSSREHVTTISVEGGDHLLETGDRATTLRLLSVYLDQLDSFFGRLSGEG